MKEEKIRVVLCEPGKMAKIEEIQNNLESFQKVVGGYIEQFCPYDEPIAIICNEEGKINGMAINRGIYDEESHELIDIIFGPFFICDCSSEDYGSLNQRQIDRFIKQFGYPEIITKSGNAITTIPYNPQDTGGKNEKHIV